MQMPGERIRKRPQISIDAIRALGLIMRTENKEDPLYLESRRVVSDGVAARLSLDPTELNRAWSRAPRDHQIAVLSALTQLAVPYIEGKEDSYVKMDCSGLMWFAWRTAGVDMPRQAVSQMDSRMRVERQDAIMGDIVGEGTHVQMYLGVGLAFIHAPFGGKKVKFKTMSDEQAARVVWTNPSHIATYRL
jgi:cell wall-associated NlpC family hydrolase